MNRDQENHDRSNADTRPRLWLTLAHRAACAPSHIKIAIAIVTALTLGLARLSYLQSHPEVPTEPASAQVVSDAKPAHSTADIEEVQAASEIYEQTTPLVDQKEAQEDQSLNWIFAILGFGLAILGGGKIALWTEKNGYDMKRFERWANRNSKKNKDDPSP